MVVVGIASTIIDALVFGFSCEIGESADDDVGLVVDAVLVLIIRADVSVNIEVGAGVSDGWEDTQTVKNEREH